MIFDFLEIQVFVVFLCVRPGELKKSQSMTNENLKIEGNLIYLGNFQSWTFVVIELRISLTPPMWSLCQCVIIMSFMCTFSSSITFLSTRIYSGLPGSPVSINKRLWKKNEKEEDKESQSAKIFFYEKPFFLLLTFFHCRRDRCWCLAESLGWDFVRALE